jgi:hypothetical protein
MIGIVNDRDKAYLHTDVKEALKEYLQELSRELELINIQDKIENENILRKDIFNVSRVWDLAREVFGEELIK